MDKDSYECYGSYLVETDIDITKMRGWMSKEIIDTMTSALLYIAKNRLDYLSICMKSSEREKLLRDTYSREFERIVNHPS